MIGPLFQMTMLIALTHAFRALGRWVGPRRSGLLMGLPSTTALILVGCGLERGLDDAALSAELCLVGLVASATLPLAYARAAAAGGGSVAAAGAAVLAYVAVAVGLGMLPRPGGAGCVAVAGAGLAVVCRLARARGIRAADEGDPAPRRALPIAHQLAFRTAIPAGYVLMIRLLRLAAGEAVAGRFITFPGGTLAVLVTTHLESGPGEARRMASAMPSGGLGMLAFLATFRYGVPALGLGWGTLAGFAAALATLAFVGMAVGTGERLETRPSGAPPIRRRRSRIDRAHPGRRYGRRTRRGGAPGIGSPAGTVRVRPREPRVRRFSPWVEPLVG